MVERLLKILKSTNCHRFTFWHLRKFKGKAFDTAAEIMSQTGANAVKIEGGRSCLKQ